MAKLNSEGTTMTTEFHTVDYEGLNPALDTLINLPDEFPLADLPLVTRQIGWTPQDPRVGQTNFHVNRPLYIATESRKKALARTLSHISFRVSDSFSENSPPSAKAIVDEAFSRVASVVETCLGMPATRERPWGDPGLTWDTPQGWQIDLVRNDFTVWLHVKSKRLHDLEIYQIQHGLVDAGL